MRFVAGLDPVELRLDPAPASFQGSNRPVEQVSWFEAMEFCHRLSRYTGCSYRLPTEAEWEYACRAGTTTPFHFGETITSDLANYNGADRQKGRYGPGPQGHNRQMSTAVDTFGVANAFGLCDMHGNVWEWCLDRWRVGYDLPSAANQPDSVLSDNQANHRVARGGSWYCVPHRCRAASRFHFPPEAVYSDLGLRVVCAVAKANQRPAMG